MNRGVEIDSDVADGPHSVILEQVTNGVAVRMAVLYLLSRRPAGAGRGRQGRAPESETTVTGSAMRRRGNDRTSSSAAAACSIRRSNSTVPATCSSSTAASSTPAPRG